MRHPIRTRNYKKCYHLHLLPNVIKGDQMHYYPKPGEIAPYYSKIVKLLNSLQLEKALVKNLIDKLKNVRVQGGTLFALEAVEVPNNEYVKDPNWMIMYAGVEADKDVKLFVGDLDDCVNVGATAKLYEMLNKILSQVLTQHQQYERAYFPNDLFINELFFTDDVTMAVDDDQNFFLNVDATLKDFLLALKMRSN